MVDTCIKISTSCSVCRFATPSACIVDYYAAKDCKEGVE